MRFLPFLLCVLLLPTLGLTQPVTYPDYESTTVNDFAGLIRDSDKAVLDAMLDELKADTGVEMVVVTLSRQADFAPDIDFETFATGLFNHWGVGESGSNSGIMVLVMHQDRAMRVELGSGFGTGWNDVAKRSIDRSFLPAFRNDNYSGGILSGVGDVMDSVARPFATGQPIPKAQNRDETSNLAGIIIMIIGTAGFFLFGPIRRLFQRCPACNTRGSLRVDRKTLTRATRTMRGRQRLTTTCRACDYHDVSERSMSRLSSSGSSSGFGGGSSSGGGASGRW